MGSPFSKILLWLAFAVMALTNAMFVLAMLIGKSSWVSEWTGVPSVILLVLAMTSFAFTAYLAHKLFQKGKSSVKTSGSCDHEFLKQKMAEESEELHRPSDEAGGRCTFASFEREIPQKTGLTRSGRRQFVAILDFFWSHLFNLHGNLTVKSKIMGADALFGLNMGVAAASFSENNAPLDYKCMRSAAFELRRLIMHSFFHESGARLDDAVISSLHKKAYKTPQEASTSVSRVFSSAESKRFVLHSLRFCIRNLLSLGGSDWLFTRGGGYDEQLVDLLASAESSQGRNSKVRTRRNMWVNEDESAYCWPFIPGCGSCCVWQSGLVVSFGVWCLHRTLELLLQENRPELLGKYNCVLKRLQGILHPAFLKPREPITPCGCLACPGTTREEIEQTTASLHGLQCTPAGFFMHMANNIEDAMSTRHRGRVGTAAGNGAFPRGRLKVLVLVKRYKRRLPRESSSGTTD